MNLTTPTVHLNGTSFKTLWEDYSAAADAHREFTRVFGCIEFNARDYYPQGPQAWEKALKEREAINQKLRDIGEYIETIRLALDEQN